MLYGESDYWVARYRSLTGGSPRQPHAPEQSRRRRTVSSGAGLLVKTLFGGTARRRVEEDSVLEGRLQR